MLFIVVFGSGEVIYFLFTPCLVCYENTQKMVHHLTEWANRLDLNSNKHFLRRAKCSDSSKESDIFSFRHLHIPKSSRLFFICFLLEIYSHRPSIVIQIKGYPCWRFLPDFKYASHKLDWLDRQRIIEFNEIIGQHLGLLDHFKCNIDECILTLIFLILLAPTTRSSQRRNVLNFKSTLLILIPNHYFIF